MSLLGILSVIGLILWIVLCLALLAGLVYVFPLVRQLQKELDRFDRVLEESEGHVEPIMTHLERSADNADYITTAIRADLEAVGETVERASRSTRRILEMAEERAREINGFLEVVQEEAEETFFSTASALRAFRSAKEKFSEKGGRRLFG